MRLFRKTEEHLLVFGLKNGEKIEVPVSGSKNMTREKALFKLFVYKNGQLIMRKGELQIPYDSIEYVFLQWDGLDKRFQDLLNKKIPGSSMMHESSKKVTGFLDVRQDDRKPEKQIAGETFDLAENRVEINLEEIKTETNEKPEIKIETGHDLQQLREKHQVTQKTVAVAIGIQPRRFSDFERGVKPIDEETKLALTDYFQRLEEVPPIEPLELFYDEETKSKKIEEIEPEVNLIEDEKNVESMKEPEKIVLEETETLNMDIIRSAEKCIENDSGDGFKEEIKESEMEKVEKKKIFSFPKRSSVKAKKQSLTKKEKNQKEKPLSKSNSKKKVKAMRVGVWAAMILLIGSGSVAFLLSTRANVESSSARNKVVALAQKIDQKEEPKDYTKQIDVYGRDFLLTYLNFDGNNQAEITERTEKLKEFLPTGEIELVSTDLTRKVNDVQLYDIVPKENYQVIQYVVDYSIIEKKAVTEQSNQRKSPNTETLNTLTTEKEVESNKEGTTEKITEKTTEKESEEQTNLQNILPGNSEEQLEEMKEVTNYTQMVSIPIQMDEQTGVIAICDLPYFSSLPENKGMIEFQNATYEGKTDVTQADRETVNSFLQQFFETYATKEDKDMQYLMENPESLEGEFEFVSAESEIFKQGDSFIVKSKPVFKIHNQPIQHKENMTLKVIKKDGKLYVEKLKHGMGVIE